jgi:O-antigen ligase
MILYQTGDRSLHFQEAHNDYLQIAAEGGLLVGVPALLVLMIFVRDVRRRFRESPKEGTTYWLRVGAAIGLLAIGLQSLFEFSLQMPGNAALFAVLAAIALHQSPRLRTARTSRQPEVRPLQPGERSFRVLKSTQTSFPAGT